MAVPYSMQRREVYNRCIQADQAPEVANGAKMKGMKIKIRPEILRKKMSGSRHYSSIVPDMNTGRPLLGVCVVRPDSCQVTLPSAKPVPKAQQRHLLDERPDPPNVG